MHTYLMQLLAHNRVKFTNRAISVGDETHLCCKVHDGVDFFCVQNVAQQVATLYVTLNELQQRDSRSNQGKCACHDVNCMLRVVYLP